MNRHNIPDHEYMATIRLQGREYEYSVRESARAKRQSIVVGWNGHLEIVHPKGKVMTERQVQNLLVKYTDWIVRHVSRMRDHSKTEPLEHRGTPKQIVERSTRNYVETRIQHFSSLYPFREVQIVLRSYRSQWGSCSKKRRIGLHYKLSLLPKELADYVIVHELCHTVHFNHSKTFWALVGELCPDYRVCRRALRQFLL